MRALLLCLAVILPTAHSPAQGTVNFFNTPGTMVSSGAPGQESAISGPVGSYYFGLLIAPPGTTDPSKFIFTGVYATNRVFPGRLEGGSNIAVPGWLPFTTMWFMVVGWSSSLGHDWNPQWQTGTFNNSGYFGPSSISTGFASGITTPPNPAFDLFGGGTGIQTGWNLVPVSPIPEPSVMTLVAAGLVLLMLRYRGVKNLWPRGQVPICASHKLL